MNHYNGIRTPIVRRQDRNWLTSTATDIPLTRICRGTFPFIAFDLVRLVLLCAFPALSLWLPKTMGA